MVPGKRSNTLQPTEGFRAFFITTLLGLVILSMGCRTESDRWHFQKRIDPDGGTLIGIVSGEEHFWVSDADQKAILKLDTAGKVIARKEGLQRPMHLAFHQGKLYVPEFLTDSIRILQKRSNKIGSYPIPSRVDGPSGIAFHKGKVALASFYGHELFLRENGEWESIGRKGSENGAFHYPTDLAFGGNELYVADAYNHRVQVFGPEGKVRRIIGSSDSLKVASGIDLWEDGLAVTDQEHGRVLLYDRKGNLRQVLSEKLVQPTDVHFQRGRLSITNGREGSILVFEKDE